MKKYLLTFFLVLLPLTTYGQSGSGVDALITALEPVKRLQGSFTQRQYAQDDTLLAESSGTFLLLRPGYFAWEIVSPDQQIIIAGPEFIWHHDRDLETVTRRPVTTNTDMMPLQILGGDESALREKFDIVQTTDGAFQLTPLATGVGFKQLTLLLDGAQITGMVIVDNLDQRIEIEFTDLDSESELTSEDFAFTPPPDADLFYYDE
ncbi:Outer-membrane lipoprotein carrier protein [Halioglobus japonicus]|nr:Outer-membrane lipoprotein carrier protein [Halioglobus japonicus]